MPNATGRSNSESEAVTLNAHEQAVINRQLNGLQTRRNASKLGPWAYANGWDWAVLSVSSVAAVIAGASNPFLNVIFGNLAGTFAGFADHSISSEELLSVTRQFALYYVYLALVQFVFIYISTIGFYWVGERLTRRMRRTYLSSIVRQNMGFFDTFGTGKVTTHITTDIAAIQEALNSKLSMALVAFANFVSAFIISFSMYWKLGLVLSTLFLSMLIATYSTTPFAIKHGRSAKDSYSAGSGIAQEAIGSIRNVTAYGSQEQLTDDYVMFLRDAEKFGIKSRVWVALLLGWCQFLPCAAYGMGFFIGGIFIRHGETKVSAVVSAVGAAINGSFAVIRVIPTIENFVSGMSSAGAVFDLIKRQSSQDPLSDEGLKPNHVEGHFELEKVELIYPSRPDTRALKGVSVQIPANKTTAFVGLSGCGKSTILGIIERFYEPTAGSVKLDGHDLQDLNLQWLRQQIAFVGQEPTLLSTSIFENIRHGLVSGNEQRTANEMKNLVRAAARLANAHDFIQDLPEDYDTEVGEKGLSLSGGQRQRIAIARAIVSNPKILLLDEATSALDTHSEKVVQTALENASKNRTTIVIAHRLSTIRAADNIVVMKDGLVVEQGTHFDLVARNGLYADLVRKQAIDDKSRERRESQKAAQEDEQIPKRGSRSYGSVAVQPTDTKVIDTPTVETPLIAQAVTHVPRFGLQAAVKFVLSLSKPDAWFLTGGLITATCAGFSLPLQGVLNAQAIDAFSYSATDPSRMTSLLSRWCSIFAILGIYTFITNMATGIYFGYSTERFSLRVRALTLCTVLRQNIAYFDQKTHSTGQLTARLGGSATDISALGGAVLGSVLTFLSTIITSLTIGFAHGWKLSLVCAATIPVIAGLGWVRMQILGVFDARIRTAGEQSAAYASEAVDAIRTVAATGLESHILDGYRDIQTELAAKSLPAILRSSALYAASQSVNFLVQALVFTYGSSLVASGEYSVTQFYICMMTLIWASTIAGALFNFAPDMSKAILAARDLKLLFERTPEIDTWSSEGTHVIKSACKGRLRLEKVSFAYPSRPNRTVLHNFDLDVPAGSFVALVGASGCGKSTTLSLLERFYDPISGQITLDGVDITILNLNHYRSLISLVSQEPTIYSGTILSNLLIGLPPFSLPSMAAVITACKEANIHSFITSLPNGFETQVGSSGSMLSGGQKQRLTIARALLRNPKILLLDEATAALDSESEHLVQEALERARVGRTTVAVAHRLSTVRRADVIVVVREGRVVEKGSHDELIQKRGEYYGLVRMQDLK